MRLLRPIRPFSRETEDLGVAALTMLLGMVLLAGLCVY